MKTVISVASVLACVLSLDAEITTSLKRLSDGTDEVRIRNTSATSLVAFVVTVKQIARNADSINPPIVVYSDPLVDSSNTALPANEERVVMRGYFTEERVSIGKSYFGGLAEPIITAGIFADGTITGDSILLGHLLVRRSNMLQAVETTLAALSNAGGHNIPRSQVIVEFQTLADSLNHWYLPPEQQVGRDLYQSIVGKLINLPEPQFGAPFPPTDFVARETSSLNRQRATLLESQPSLGSVALIEFRTHRDPKSK